MSVQERVLKVVSGETQKSVAEDQLEKNFEELGIDSLDKVCILFGLEQEFNISIPEAEARQITNVRQIIDRLSQEAASGPQAGAAASPATKSAAQDD